MGLALAGCGGGQGGHAPPDLAVGATPGADLAVGVGVPRDAGVADASTGGGIVPIDGGAGAVPLRSCTTTFTFSDPSPASVAVAGEFNAWSATANPLTGPDVNGQWQASIALPAGAYAYKFVATDPTGAVTWQLDAGNPYTKFVGGVENSVVEVADCQLPEVQYQSLTATAAGALTAAVQYVDGSGAAGPDASKLVVTLDGAPADGTIDASGLIRVSATGLAKTKHRLIVQAADRAGHAAVDLHVPFWVQDKPFDFRDGLMYFAFTDRFRDGDASNNAATPGVDPRANYEGGDFAGITQAIDDGYFDSLSVRTIWISPPNKNPDDAQAGTGNHLYSGYHGYWPTAADDIQPRFGDLNALKTLVAHAHTHGIRVLIDAVLNHVHLEHPYWVQHQNDGWFNPSTINGQPCECGDPGCGDWTTARETCWFESYLPDLDYTNWDALTTMIDDVVYWAREADVDGFRVDAVKHFKLAATKRLRGKLHDQFEWTGPMFYLVGETFDGDRSLIESFIGPQALHGQFDFPIYFAITDTLSTYSQSLRELESATAQSDAAFGDAVMSPFFGNQDVSRFLSTAAGQLAADPSAQAWDDANRPVAPTTEDAYFKLRLALTFVATSPGVPLIYYGDEYGQPGADDPDNRRFMKWNGYSAFEQTTINVTQKLGAARAELPALRYGIRRTLWIDDNLYVYARVDGSNVAIIVINRDFGGGNTTAVPVPADLPLANGTILNDRLGGAPITVVNNTIPLNIPAHSSAVLAP
ncbi:MAG TPA: alpha-amylase family glycosyl hydrolase [Polyangia bacterium]|nr:alpha-amylase family glycosyl hydrolase [Polyangia bacterium]